MTRSSSSSSIGISIHALREEGDDLRVSVNAVEVIMSIHALREEGDKAADGVCDDRDVFLSTPSARRATLLPLLPSRQ